jgi:hypothetical protein
MVRRRQRGDSWQRRSISLVGTYNNEQIAVMEKGKPERRFRAETFTRPSDYAWLDEGRLLYRISSPPGETRFYTLDAVSGAKELVATIAVEAAPRIGPVGFGVATGRRFWYVAGDGVKHEVAVPEPGTPAR